jgi:hypothetical protein
VAVLCALVAGTGVAFWLKHEQTVSAEALPNAARIQRVDGEVAFSNGLPNNQASDGAEAQWVAATPNEPFSVGDRIYTRENSHASLAFTGRNFARLYPNTSLDVLSLANDRTQLALRDGSAVFDLGYLAPGELFEVATPYGAVDLNQPGLYNVGINPNGSATVSVLNGLAQVVGLGGSGQISKGEMLTLAAQAAANVALSRLDRRNAGYLVDDYYSYQYPQYYDGRYSDYDAYLNDPYYFDPYRRNSSYQYVNEIIPGINDLDYYGDWQNVSNYGYCWRPRVDSGWAPYQQGYWATDYPYGPTWVSTEPWGYAPYHYGRWTNAGNQWFWIPDGVNTTPIYSPALVAFIPLTQANEIGWVPLGPGDPYAPRYYNENWQPNYLTRTSVVQQRVVNLDVPGAVTVVPVSNFTQIIDPRRITRADRQTLAQVRPVLDPLTVTPLRNAVLHSAWGRGKIDLPPGIAKKLYNTPVITSAAPSAPPFRRDLARSMRVEPVPEGARNQKLQIRDERQAQAPRTSDQAAQERDAARRQQMAATAAEAARGNKDARRQMQQLGQQQQQQQQQQQRQALIQQQNAGRAAARAQQREQVQGERVARPARQQVQREGRQPQAQRSQPMRTVQPQQRAQQSVQRPQAVQQMRQQPRQNAPERRGPPPQAQQPRPQAQQPRQNVERRQGPPQAVQQTRQQAQQPHQNAAERRGPPAQAQQPQPQQKQGPPAQSQGQGGKDKNKKP